MLGEVGDFEHAANATDKLIRMEISVRTLHPF